MTSMQYLQTVKMTSAFAQRSSTISEFVKNCSENKSWGSLMFGKCMASTPSPFTEDSSGGQGQAIPQGGGSLLIQVPQQ